MENNSNNKPNGIPVRPVFRMATKLKDAHVWHSLDEIEDFFNRIWFLTEIYYVEAISTISSEHICDDDCEIEHPKYTQELAEKVHKRLYDGVVLARQTFTKHIIEPIREEYKQNPTKTIYVKTDMLNIIVEFLDSLIIDTTINEVVLNEEIPDIKAERENYIGVEMFFNIVKHPEYEYMDASEINEALEFEKRNRKYVKKLLNYYETKIPETNILQKLYFLYENIENFTAFFSIELGATFFKRAIISVIAEDVLPKLIDR